jgi:hypothetical protein
VGLAGAETKALPCWVKKTLLTLPIAPAIAALAAPGAIAKVPTLLMKVPVVLVWVVTQFWANADEADINTVTTAPASTLRFRFAIDAMKIILSPQKRIRPHFRSPGNLNQARVFGEAERGHFGGLAL